MDGTDLKYLPYLLFIELHVKVEFDRVTNIYE